MTEHFTREEAVAVADASGMLDCKLADFETTLQAFANAAVTAKLKEWEAQGAVAGWLHELPDGSFHFSKVDPSNHDPQEADWAAMLASAQPQQKEG